MALITSGCGSIRSVQANNPQQAETHFGAGALRDLRSVRWPVGMGVCPVG